VSGATGRANADTQQLFNYLWTNCPNTHCAVGGGRGGTAAADFSANKTITVMDWRGRTAWGLDDMGATAAGRILPSNVTSGGGDTVTTPNATGGEANHTLVTAEIPSVTPSGSISGVTASNFNIGSQNILYQSGVNNVGAPTSQVGNVNGSTFSFTGIPFGGGGAHNTMAPFILGSWYIKL
jgi:microcystin-dependent protein